MQLYEAHRAAIVPVYWCTVREDQSGVYGLEGGRHLKVEDDLLLILIFEVLIVRANAA